MRLEQICRNVGITKDNQHYCRARSIADLDCRYLGDLFGPRKKPYRFCEKPEETILKSVFKNLRYVVMQMYNYVVK